MTLFLITAALFARVSQWEHYPHYGGGNCIIIHQDKVLSGTSGGVLFAHYSEDEMKLVADSGWTSPYKLSYDRVSHVTADEQGNLWVSMNGGGIDVFSPQGEKTHFNQIDGLPLNLGINQTIPDSVVYAATTQGLCVREFGYFDIWDSYETGGGLPSDNVNCIASSDSGLYAGTTAGLVFIARSAPPSDPASWELQGIDQTSVVALEWQNDTLWTATTGKLFRKPPQSSWEEVTSFPGGSISSLAWGSGGLAVGCTDMCYLLKDDTWNIYDANLHGNALTGLVWHQDRLYGVLANTYSENRASGSGLALLLPDSTWRRTFPEFGPVSNDVRGCTLLSDGSLWSVTNRNGASVLANSQWINVNLFLTSTSQCFSVCESGSGVFISSLGFGADWLGWDGEQVTQQLHFTSSDGLANNRIFHSASADDGTVWFAHRTLFEIESSGVSRLSWSPGDPSGASFTVLSDADGLPSKEVNAVLPLNGRYAWAGTDEGLAYVDADRQMVLNTYGTLEGLPSSLVTSLSMDRSGVLYIGTASGLAMLDHGEVTPVDQVDWAIDAIACDDLGSTWLATSDGLKRFTRSSGSVEEYTPFNSPLPEGMIYSISVDSDQGYIWLATDHGLWRGELESGLTGDGSQASVYPNPFLPGTGEVLGIAGIPDEPLQIKVFDLTGSLVYEYASTGRDDFAWNGFTAQGDPAASGVYVILATPAQGEPYQLRFTLVR